MLSSLQIRSRSKTRKSSQTTSAPIKKPQRSARVVLSEEQKRQMISETAYLIAEKRGFQNGDPVSDWLAAESLINRKLREL